jgi:hypothetical protein
LGNRQNLPHHGKLKTNPTTENYFTEKQLLDLDELGMLDTIGYVDFQDSQQLFIAVSTKQPFASASRGNSYP